MLSGEQLRTAGFTQEEIDSYVTANRTNLQDAGFTDMEISQFFGGAPSNDKPIEAFTQTQLIAEKDKPKAFDRFIDLFRPSWEKQRGRAGVSLTLAEETGLRPSTFEPSPTQALKKGLKSSVSGLLTKGKVEEPFPIEVMERLPTKERILLQAGMLAGDMPFMIGGAILGSGGGPLTATGGAFALPAGLRQVLTDKYEKGEIKNSKDFLDRLSSAVLETLKGEAVGVTTAAVGHTVTPLLKLPAEVATMTTLSSLLEGEMPEPQDFIDGALLIGGLHVATKAPKIISPVEKKLTQIYNRKNLKPEEVVKETDRNASVKEDVLSENIEIPREYEPKLTEKFRTIVIPERLKEGFEVLKEQVLTAEKGVLIKDELGHIVSGLKGSFPEWFKKQKTGDKSFDRAFSVKEVVSLIEKAEKDEFVTQLQWRRWNRLLNAAESEALKVIDPTIAEMEILETKKGFKANVEKIPAVDLDKGDKAIIKTSRGLEEFESRGIDPKTGEVILKDGETFKLDPFEQIQPEMIKRKGGKPIEKPKPLAQPPKPFIKPSIDKTAKAKVLDRISINEKARKEAFTFDRFYTAMIDDLHPLHKATKKLAAKLNLPEKENPYTLARLHRGWHGKAEHFLEYSPFDFRTKKNIGKSLRSILEPIKDELDDFRAYAVARRSKELAERKIKTGIDLKDAEKVIKEFSKFDKVFEDLKAYQDLTLQYLQDSGILSERAINNMRVANKEYVPFYRLTDKDIAGTRKDLQAKQPIKKIKGSKRVIYDPLESIIKNTYLYINLAEKNRIGQALVKLGEKSELKDQNIITKIKQPKRPVKVPTKELNKLAKDLGLKLTDETLTVFLPQAFYPKEDVISVWKKGKRKFYQVDKDLGRTFQALDTEQIPLLLRMLSKPAHWLRAGAVLSPEFIARNPVRDQFSAAVYSNYGFIPAYNLVRGVSSLIKKDQYYRDWIKSGGLNSALVSLDRKYFQKNLEQVTGPRAKNIFKTPLEVLHSGVRNIVKNPIEALRILSELSEQGTRLGEFKAGRKKGATLEKAGFSSREVTLDFARIGTRTKALNSLIAFWNANVQGTDRLIRAFKDKPVQTTAKIAASITLPSVLLEILNHDEEWYQDVPRWQKDLFWLFKAKDIIWRIPKPFELGIIFGTIPERFTSWILDQDPKALDGVLKAIWRGSMPGILPTVSIPLIENWANKSFFLDRPLVNADREELLPEYQYKPYTTELIKAAGKLLGSLPALKMNPYIAPVKIENIIKGWSGGLGTHLVNIANYALTEAGLLPEKIKPTLTLADIPIIKAFVVRHPSAGAEPIQKFYDKYFEYSKFAKTAQALVKKELDFDEAEILINDNRTLLNASGHYDALRNMHRLISLIYVNPQILPEEKRQLIDRTYYDMIAIAKDGLRLFEEIEKLDTKETRNPIEALRILSELQE
jgi:hypothetical protein